MAALSRKLRSWSGDGRRGVSFWCPGCDGVHAIAVEVDAVSGQARLRANDPACWVWDGNAEAPTFSPSVLVTYNGPDHDTPEALPARCHSFVRAGVIEFLGDCTHKFAGQRVPLPDWPEGY